MNIKVAVLAALLVLLANAGVHGREYKIGSIEIVDPWSRATPKGAKVAAGYLTLKNTGTAPDRLVGGTAPFAGRFEIHEMKMEKGVAKMRELADGVEIKSGETVELKPGSLHVMFTDLTKSLVKGERAKATLVFERAGTIEVEFLVEAAGATKSGGHLGQ